MSHWKEWVLEVKGSNWFDGTETLERKLKYVFYSGYFMIFFCISIEWLRVAENQKLQKLGFLSLGGKNLGFLDHSSSRTIIRESR